MAIVVSECFFQFQCYCMTLTPLDALLFAGLLLLCPGSLFAHAIGTAFFWLCLPTQHAVRVWGSVSKVPGLKPTWLAIRGRIDCLAHRASEVLTIFSSLQRNRISLSVLVKRQTILLRMAGFIARCFVASQGQHAAHRLRSIQHPC